MINGFILINKEKNISSSKIDYYLKKEFSLNKCGHLGTLDPLAVGLLVVGINKGTKYFKYFDNLDKKYILTIRLGATTDSLDYEKEITKTIDTDLRKKEKLIDDTLLSFKKKYNQIPPIYSAIKSNGKKLYEYALTNKEVLIKSREVEIYDIKRTSEIIYDNGSTYFDILLHVSKGFYVRSFANEFAQSLNTIGMAHRIERIEVGPFKLIDAVKKENYKENLIFDPLNYLKLKEYDLNDESYKKVSNGVRMHFNSKDELILLKYKNRNIAIYRLNNDIYEMDEYLE